MMVRVVIFAEGETERKFVEEVLAPTLALSMVHLYPQTLPTSRNARGGAVSFERFKHHARNTLKMPSAPFLSTFLDLYGLDTGFPGFQDAEKITDPRKRAVHLEAALYDAIVAESGCRPERFLPHIQPFEFEGLLFSDVEALCSIESEWRRFRGELAKIRAAFESPEHINDSYDTKPSKRLGDILSPKYRKTRHGPLAARRITSAAMEKECAHFRAWMDTLRGLSA